MTILDGAAHTHKRQPSAGCSSELWLTVCVQSNGNSTGSRHRPPVPHLLSPPSTAKYKTHAFHSIKFRPSSHPAIQPSKNQQLIRQSSFLDYLSDSYSTTSANGVPLAIIQHSPSPPPRPSPDCPPPTLLQPSIHPCTTIRGPVSWAPPPPPHFGIGPFSHATSAARGLVHVWCCRCEPQPQPPDLVPRRLPLTSYH